jgi:hypothetical protein
MNAYMNDIDLTRVDEDDSDNGETSSCEGTPEFERPGGIDDMEAAESDVAESNEPVLSLPSGVVVEPFEFGEKRSSDSIGEGRRPRIGEEIEAEVGVTLESAVTKRYRLSDGGDDVPLWCRLACSLKVDAAARFTIAEDSEVLFIWLTASRRYTRFGDVVKVSVEEGHSWTRPDAEDDLLVSVSFETDTAEEPVRFCISSLTLSKLDDICVTDVVRDSLRDAIWSMNRSDVIHLEVPGRAVDAEMKRLRLELMEVRPPAQRHDELPHIEKQRLWEGSGWEETVNGASVTVRVYEQSQSLAASLVRPSCHEDANEEKTFTCGDGRVCDALEVAVLMMRAGEIALLRAPHSVWFGGELAEETGKIVELVELSIPSAPRDREERMERSERRRAAGVECFKQGRVWLARASFRQALHILEDVNGESNENVEKGTAPSSYFDSADESELRRRRDICRLNIAACCLRLHVPKNPGYAEEALKHCRGILDSSHGSQDNQIKALYRGALAASLCGLAEESMNFLKKLAQMAPSLAASGEMRAVWDRSRTEIAARLRKEAEVCRRMFADPGEKKICNATDNLSEHA